MINSEQVTILAKRAAKEALDKFTLGDVVPEKFIGLMETFGALMYAEGIIKGVTLIEEGGEQIAKDQQPT